MSLCSVRRLNVVLVACVAPPCRYLEAYRFPSYEQRELGLVGLVGAPPPPPGESLEVAHLNKRPRLGLLLGDPNGGGKAAPHQQPLLIDTSSAVHLHAQQQQHPLLLGGVEVKKEPCAYVPQTEAISPTLPGEDSGGRPPLSPPQAQGPPRSSAKDDLLNAINRLDREIAQVESQTNKLRKKQVSGVLPAPLPRFLVGACRDTNLSLLRTLTSHSHCQLMECSFASLGAVRNLRHTVFSGQDCWARRGSECVNWGPAFFPAPFGGLKFPAPVLMSFSWWAG